MEKLIKLEGTYNPYKILDKLESFLTGYSLTVSVSGVYSLDNVYNHSFSAGGFECRITNSPVSSSEFDIRVNVYQMERGYWKMLFDKDNYNLAIRPNYEGLIELIKSTLNKYIDSLNLETQRAVKIENLLV